MPFDTSLHVSRFFTSIFLYPVRPPSLSPPGREEDARGDPPRPCGQIALLEAPLPRRIDPVGQEIARAESVYRGAVHLAEVAEHLLFEILLKVPERACADLTVLAAAPGLPGIV